MHMDSLALLHAAYPFAHAKLVCKIHLLARALGLKAEHPLEQERAQRYGILRA